MVRMPRIVGARWFNSSQLDEGDLKEKVVLVDFWTYSCVNCLRTLPYLKQWWQKYKDKGFVIIGVHTPEFDFEKDPSNVKRAISELGIEWPIVTDNQYKNWNNFANHFWPAKYIANKNGEIVYSHPGEGGYEETERWIQDLLGNFEKHRMPKIQPDIHTHGKVCFIPTPELYCGYSRGKLSYPQEYKKEVVAEYVMPPIMEKDKIALSQKFLAKPEYVESYGEDSIIYVQFHGTEVNLVLEPVDKQVQGQVFFDNQMLLVKTRGKNVNELGELKIDRAKMYNLLRSKSLVM